MFGEYKLTIALCAGMALVLYVGSTFSPVIPRGEQPAGVPELAQNTAQAYGYCRTNLDRVDCGCFASRAGQIMSEPGLNIRGAETIDRTELARLQATDSC
ncbi:hypothetical protein AB3Y40_00280 [Yoonia sp. R2331]|uniref:hypothetical protein n=1 Tax=Yoonia sp. R2331 TaxID=3237238 RepID=UPI0034E47F84